MFKLFRTRRLSLTRMPEHHSKRQDNFHPVPHIGFPSPISVFWVLHVPANGLVAIPRIDIQPERRGDRMDPFRGRDYDARHSFP